jgi:hypothetical protein
MITGQDDEAAKAWEAYQKRMQATEITKVKQ